MKRLSGKLRQRRFRDRDLRPVADELAVHHLPLELVYDDDAGGDEPRSEALIGGDEHRAQELAGQTVVLGLPQQRIVTDPEPGDREGDPVVDGLQRENRAVELPQLLARRGGNGVVDREARSGEVGVPGVGVAEPLRGTREGEASGHRVVEPEIVADLQVALPPIHRRREDQDQVLLLGVPAEDDGPGRIDSLTRPALRYEVFRAEI